MNIQSPDSIRGEGHALSGSKSDTTLRSRLGARALRQGHDRLRRGTQLVCTWVDPPILGMGQNETTRGHQVLIVIPMKKNQMELQEVVHFQEIPRSTLALCSI